MRFGKSVVASVILAVMMIGVSVQAAPDDPWVMKPVEKLGRGIANVAFLIRQADSNPLATKCMGTSSPT